MIRWTANRRRPVKSFRDIFPAPKASLESVACSLHGRISNGCGPAYGWSPNGHLSGRSSALLESLLFHAFPLGAQGAERPNGDRTGMRRNRQLKSKEEGGWMRSRRGRGGISRMAIEILRKGGWIVSQSGGESKSNGSCMGLIGFLHSHVNRDMPSSRQIRVSTCAQSCELCISTKE